MTAGAATAAAPTDPAKVPGRHGTSSQAAPPRRARQPRPSYAHAEEC